MRMTRASGIAESQRDKDRAAAALPHMLRWKGPASRGCRELDAMACWRLRDETSIDSGRRISKPATAFILRGDRKLQHRLDLCDTGMLLMAQRAVRRNLPEYLCYRVITFCKGQKRFRRTNDLSLFRFSTEFQSTVLKPDLRKASVHRHQKIQNVGVESNNCRHATPTVHTCDPSTRYIGGHCETANVLLQQIDLSISCTFPAAAAFNTTGILNPKFLDQKSSAHYVKQIYHFAKKADRIWRWHNTVLKRKRCFTKPRSARIG